MTLNEKRNVLLVVDGCKDLNLGSWVYDDKDGDSFLLVESWEELRQLEQWVRERMTAEEIADAATFRDGEYETQAVDWCMNDNWGFMDEWTTCHHCGTVIRTAPDSYHWTPQYWVTDCELLCKDCTDIHEYLDSMTNDHRKAVTLFDRYEIEAAGYTQVNTEHYENGFHHGMTDNPKAILDRLLDSNPAGEYVFCISEQSQFYIKFDVYEKDKEDEEDENC